MFPIRLVFPIRFPFGLSKYCYRPQTKFAKVMFLHVSVILSTGGCYLSIHCRWYPSMPCSRSPGGGSPGPQPRGKLRGSGPGPQPRGKLKGSGLGVGVVCPRGRGRVPAPGVSAWGVSALEGGVWRPPRQLLLRAVRILLECILVHNSLTLLYNRRCKK